MMHMPRKIVLASGSETRAALLTNAGVSFGVVRPRIDEAAIRAGLEHEDARPRDIADTLAEFKGRKVAGKYRDALVIGCDQVLDFNGEVLSKAATRQGMEQQLRALRGTTHRQISAVVVFQDGQPMWRHVGVAKVTMRNFSDGYLGRYLERNWEETRHCVGGYMLEGEGARLVSHLEGGYFTVLGLPLLALLSYLSQQGAIDA